MTEIGSTKIGLCFRGLLQLLYTILFKVCDKIMSCSSVKNCLVFVLGIIAAQVVDYVWYSGLLPWQAEANRDIVMGVIMSVILSAASCLVYGLAQLTVHFLGVGQKLLKFFGLVDASSE